MFPVSLWRSVINTVKSFGLSVLLAFVVLFILSLLVNCALLYYVGGTLFLTSILANFVPKWMPKERISHERKAVFITGCDRGFGYMLAQRLDDIGFQVFAGCLFPDGDGAANLRNSGSNRLHVLGLDVTSDTSVQEAAAYVKENLNENVLWAVVNNAGIPGIGELHWTSIEAIQRIFEVNTIGVTRVTKAFLSKLKESKGRVVIIASVAGRDVTPWIVPYCMSKAAAISFSDGLRLEMYKWGIQVITVEPTFHSTPIINEEELNVIMRKEWNKAPQDEKDIYGPNYLEKFRKRAFLFPKLFAKHPSGVVSTMEDAISSVLPEYNLTTGSIAFRLLMWSSRRVPRSIADLATFYFMGLDLR